MPDYTIRSLCGADAQAVYDLELAYARAYPGAAVVPPALYLSPSFHGGQDVLCAFDPEARLLAYAPLYLQPTTGDPAATPTAWMEIKAYPDQPEPRPVKDALFDCLQARLRDLLAETGLPAGPVRVTFEYDLCEAPAAAYVLERGFTCSESVFHMARDLTVPLPEPPSPRGLSIQLWKMPAPADQQAYVDTRNACFPGAPIRLEAWQYFLTSPQWQAGTAVAAFDGARLVGCASVFWDEDEIREAGLRFGYTEDIFVRADYRGRGAASAMIAAGLAYLQSHGMREARLAVRAANANALALYLRLGYTLRRESRFYTRDINN